MSERHYEKFIHEFKITFTPIATPNHKPIAQLVRAFEAHGDTLSNMIILPGIIAATGLRSVQRANKVAELFIGNIKRITTGRMSAEDVQAELQRWDAEYLEKIKPESEKVKEIVDYLNGFEEQSFKQAISALLSSVVVFSWTGFECLCTDTWVEAVNSRPSALARSAASSADKDSNDAAEYGRPSGKSVPFELIAKNSFDLRGCMGEILKAKFEFTSVRKIKKAYVAAFGKLPEFDAIFDDPEVVKLQAIRNLIVHRAGLVDEAFNSRMNLALPVGSQYEFIGQDAGQYVSASIRRGLQLVKFVDDYLTAHPA